MRKFASSVTIITTTNGGEHHGMTATAVFSVSADPPTVLVVINRTARTHPLIGSAGAFTVNLMAGDQQALADRFSAKHPNQFEGLDFDLSPNMGSPVFRGVASFLECRLISQMDVGTHTVFFGEVLHCHAATVDPLVYYDGAYIEKVRACAA
jgi:flavin reductase (DIM6/NTAB) family NADH-FMN oxidoreductase RutF